jgi:hypothetical protein
LRKTRGDNLSRVKKMHIRGFKKRKIPLEIGEG